jgi:hypothetical protein
MRIVVGGRRGIGEEVVVRLVARAPQIIDIQAAAPGGTNHGRRDQQELSHSQYLHVQQRSRQGSLPLRNTSSEGDRAFMQRFRFFLTGTKIDLAIVAFKQE